MKNSAEQLPKHDYKLCILVPAYNYFEGVERILDLVKSDDRVSVVISDDSDDYDCATKIKNMVQTVNLERVVYMHGPGKGAGQNWNSLFKYINAEYYTFLHHDEVYSDLSFVDVIETSIDLECLILPCLVIHANGVRKISSRHQKGTMFVAKRFVPVFNFLGPTSTLIVKSDIKPIIQRRFSDIKEKEETISMLHGMGINTQEYEDDGNFYADFYICLLYTSPSPRDS